MSIYKSEKYKWEKGKGQLGSLGGHVNTAILKTDNQQGYTVQYMELCSILCNNSNGKRSPKKEQIHVYINK